MFASTSQHVAQTAAGVVFTILVFAAALLLVLFTIREAGQTLFRYVSREPRFAAGSAITGFLLGFWIGAAAQPSLTRALWFGLAGTVILFPIAKWLFNK